MKFYYKIIIKYITLVINYIINIFLSLLGYLFSFSNLCKTNSLTINKPIIKHQEIISYIINLDRSETRFSYVEPQVKNLGFATQRISAIDGNMLSENEFNKQLDIQSYKKFLGHNPKKGTIGCSLSHIKAWEKFLASKYDFALIFEDDISFNSEVLAATVKELMYHTNLWDIVSFDIKHRGTPLNIITLNSGLSLSVYLTEITHAGAYLLTKHSALKLYSKALPIRMPIDHYFTRGWEFNLRFMGIEPRIASQSFGDSNINETARYKEQDYDFALKLNKAIFKLQSYIKHFYYNLKIYLCIKIKL